MEFNTATLAAMPQSYHCFGRQARQARSDNVAARRTASEEKSIAPHRRLRPRRTSDYQTNLPGNGPYSARAWRSSDLFRTALFWPSAPTPTLDCKSRRRPGKCFPQKRAPPVASLHRPTRRDASRSLIRRIAFQVGLRDPQYSPPRSLLSPTPRLRADRPCLARNANPRAPIRRAAHAVPHH